MHFSITKVNGVGDHIFVIAKSREACYGQFMTTSTVKRKMGRPPIAGEAMEQISVRLTQQELARIDDLASRLGISRNEALRTYLAKGFKRQ